MKGIYPSAFGDFAKLMNAMAHISKAKTTKVLMIVFSYSINVNTIPTLLKGMRGRNTYVNE
ncbi:MAG: hypothetical protein JO327_01155 [Nitrososphaeraceae archaeon]|nr:hypothetical protein [Nitrososphaeraceae archaeon]